MSLLSSITSVLLESAPGPLLQALFQLRPQIAEAAQAQYDAWDQDQDGQDHELGAGGPCDLIAQDIQGILSGAGIESIDGGQDGDDHAYVIAYTDTEAVEVDVPHELYERGSGYSWRKVPGVVFGPDSVQLTSMKREWLDLGDQS